MGKKTKEQQRHANIRAYGITVDIYNQMYEDQKGLCWICTGLPTDGKSLNVDHCHKTKQVRGLLCNLCNRALGLFRDDPAILSQAMWYLIEAPVHQNLKDFYKKNKALKDQEELTKIQLEYKTSLKLLKKLHDFTISTAEYEWQKNPEADLVRRIEIRTLRNDVDWILQHANV